MVASSAGSNQPRREQSSRPGEDSAEEPALSKPVELGAEDKEGRDQEDGDGVGEV